MGTGSIIQIAKTTKVKIKDFLNKTIKPEDIDFVREYGDNEQARHFDNRDTNWNQYENDCRQKIYESGKWPVMGLSNDDLIWIRELYFKGAEASIVAMKYVHKSDELYNNRKNQVEIKNKIRFDNSKNEDFIKNDTQNDEDLFKDRRTERSPFDRRKR